VQADAEGLLKHMTQGDGALFVAEKLDALAERRGEVQNALTDLSEEIEKISRQAVDENVVREALAHIGEVYECLPPYRRKDLIGLVVDRAEISETQLKLGFKGRPPSVEVLKRGEILRENASRSETSEWLLGLMSQSSVIFDLAELKATRGLWSVLRLRLERGTKGVPRI